MYGHAMSVLVRPGGGRFYVYCICGWHFDNALDSIHEASTAWYNHAEGWHEDEPI